MEFIYSHSENRVLLKTVLGSMAGFTHVITAHKQTQLNRVCYFHVYGVLLASKGSTFSELISFGLAVDCSHQFCFINIL